MAETPQSLVRANLRDVRKSVARRQFDEARGILSALRAYCPAEPQILLDVGAAHLSVAAYADARTFFHAALLKAEPQSTLWAKAIKRLAQESARAGAFAQAVSRMESYLKIFPKDAPNADKLLLWKIKDSAPADWNHVLDTHRNRFGATEALILFGDLVLEPRTRADWDDFIAAQTRVFVRNPDITVLAVDILIGRGELQDAFALALALFQAKHPGSRELNCLMRAARAHDLPDDQAIALYDAYLSLNPDDPKAFIGRARRLSKLRRLGEVVAVSSQALVLDPDSWDAIELCAKALMKLDRPCEANAVCDTFFRRLGENADEHLLRIVNLELELGRVHSAAERVAQCERSREPIADLAEARIAVMLAAGRYREAWPLIEERVAVSDNAALREQAIQCRTALSIVPPHEGQFPDALYRQVFARAPAEPVERPDAPVVLVTSTLTAGGAERQIALTASRISRVLTRPVHLVGRDLRSENGNAVMLPLLQDSSVAVTDLSARSAALCMRELRARNAISNDDVKVISAFPSQLARPITLLYDHFVTTRPAVVHLWQDGIISAGSVAAVLAGVPRIIASVRNVVPPSTDTRRYRPYLAAMYAALNRRGDVTMTANSDAGARDYEAQLELTPGSIRTIHNGVDVEAIIARASAADARDIRAALGIGDHDLVMGGVFRLVPAKKPFLWLDVAAALAHRIDNIHFVIVGDGSLREALERHVQALGMAGRVHFAGRQSPVEPWIRAMDLLLLASEVEGLPNVLLEAQSLGVSVVTTRAGGSAEAVDHGSTGLVTADDTVETLASACTAILQSQTFRTHTAAAGPDFVRRTFGVETMVEKTLAAYFS